MFCCIHGCVIPLAATRGAAGAKQAGQQHKPAQNRRRVRSEREGFLFDLKLLFLGSKVTTSSHISTVGPEPAAR